jgi:hypothetical protein
MRVTIRGEKIDVPLEALPFIFGPLSASVEQKVEASRIRAVKRWLLNPPQLLEVLTLTYERAIALCPEGVSGLNIVSEDVVGTAEYILATQINPRALAKRIELARFSVPSLPIHARVLQNVAEAAQHPEPKRLTKAMQRWNASIVAVRAWAKSTVKVTDRRAIEEKDLVDIYEIAKRITLAGVEISAKRLNNSQKKSWGPHHSKRRNAFLFDWNRIRPIIEGEFSVKFKK